MARIAEPLAPITESDQRLAEKMEELLALYSPVVIVLGLPRGLDGQETEQTTYVRQVFAKLKAKFPHEKFYLVDEAGTTKEAEVRAKQGESVDSVAAGIIGEDFLAEVMRGNVDGITL
jgi:RNase H-fold protein (predicted Holliday junction resolvase)